MKKWSLVFLTQLLLLPTALAFARIRQRRHEGGTTVVQLMKPKTSTTTTTTRLLASMNPSRITPVPSIVEMPLDVVVPSPPSRGVIMVDPFSKFHSGYMMDLAVTEYGVGVVRVISPYIATGLQQQLQQQQRDDNNDDDDDNNNILKNVAPLDVVDLRRWVNEIPFEIQAVICESDSGLAYAETLACVLHDDVGIVSVRHNGLQEARRDKFAMNEVCGQHNIPVVQQRLCSSVEDGVNIAHQIFGCTSELTTSIPVIVKPRRGVASDRVALCKTLDDIPGAVQAILDSTVFGTYDMKHDAVLLQEYVDGTEYAIDVVSKHGVHKVAALWVYDKTSTSEDGVTNPFAYLSGKLVSDDCEQHATAVMDYTEECLNALGIQWGMTHSEVKVRSDGSIRLMEVNVRQQNDNFMPLCDACLGYNAMDLCLSAYLDEDGLFESVPHRPNLLCSGMIVNLACFVEGTVSSIHHLEEIESLESVQAIELYPSFHVGQAVRRTKDIRSDCGWIHLVNESEENMMEDYAKICEWMPSIFEVE
jgi:biotin carboxylase